MKALKNELPKHHFLSVFYIKGFEIGNSRQCFWKYEKSVSRVKPPRRIAATEFFYESGANTFEDLPGDPEAVEKVYSEFEGRMATTHKAILSGEMTFGLFEEYLFFIIFLYYRAPQNELIVNRITENLSPEQLGYAIKQRETGEHISEEHEKEITDRPSWKRLNQVFVTAMILMSQKDAVEEVYRHTSVIKTKNILVSDSPILFLGEKGFENGISEFMFPMDREHSLIHCKGNHQPFESERFDNIRNAQLAKQAHEYVICTDRDYLEQLMQEIRNETI